MSRSTKKPAMPTNHLMRVVGKQPVGVPRLSASMRRVARWVLLKRIREAGITELKETKFIGMDSGQVVVEANGRQEKLEADTIVFAMGMCADRRLYDELQGRIEHLYIIGDCVDCKTIHEAIHAAWELGGSI